jgi:hypothetical protein
LHSRCRRPLTWYVWSHHSYNEVWSKTFSILLCTKFGQNPLKDVDSRVFTRMLCGKNLTRWPWKSIGFQTLLRTKHVPSLVKIHWRMLILESSQGCDAVKIWHGDKGHRVKFLPHNILVNTLESTSFNGFWPNLVHT